MDIREWMQKLHNASTDAEQEQITATIKEIFDSLSEVDKELVRKEFLLSLDEKLEETKEALKRIDMAIELREIANYVSLSKIAKNYFGKSKEWLYQRINGYKVNGSPAQFTQEERAKLAMALQDISRMANETSLRIL